MKRLGDILTARPAIRDPEDPVEMVRRKASRKKPARKRGRQKR